MTQFDAGPGEWSDRPWDDPDRKPEPQARRRRVTLPPWALLTGLVAIVIVLCVGLVMLVNGIRGKDPKATPTAETTMVAVVPTTAPSATWTPAAVITQTPTATVVLPITGTPEPQTFTEIAPGASVLVQGTLGGGLNLREQPSTDSKIVINVKEGTTLTVLDGPREAGGYEWWQLKAPDGKEGWGAGDWLVLKTEE